MAGNWLATPRGWSVSQGSGNSSATGPRRYVLTAENRRRWETVAADGHELREIAKALHRAGRCLRDEPLDAVLPAGVVPPHVHEIPQRRCRDCVQALRLDRFSGAARTCSACTRKLCRGPKADVVDCPVCHEPRARAVLAPVPGIGVACPSCALEATKAAERAAAEVVLVRSRACDVRPVERPRPAPEPAADDDWFSAMAAATAAFAAPASTPVVDEALRLEPVPATPHVVLRLPQVRDFGRMRTMLRLVASGMTSPRDLGVAMGARPNGAARHASYYREAAEILGLLEARRWTLTALGERFLAVDQGSEEERAVLREAVVGADALGPLVSAVLATAAPELGVVVDEMAARLPKLSRATLERRVRDTLSWRAALGLEPLARAPARRKPAPARVTTRPAQLRLWEPSANDPPPLRRPRVTAGVQPPLVEAFG